MAYHLQVVSTDEFGNTATSDDLAFQTPVPPDTVSPTISGTQATDITTTSATIVWTTNEPASSQVEYGVTSGYGSSTTLTPALVTAHSQAMSGLQPSTLYYLRVTSRDAAGNVATSTGFSFRTATPRTACDPRPSVAVLVRPDGPGALRVTLTAGTSELLPANAIKALRFGAATNARIEIPGQPARSGSFDVALALGTRETSFVVNRVEAGRATTVPLVVVDACGDWRTIVGGGPNGFKP
jgi:hypothetical protein